MSLAEEYFKNIRVQLEEFGDSERAEKEKQYLKSPLKFHGVNVPTSRKLAKRFKKDHPDISFQELVDVAETLWCSEYHEEKMLGVRILEQYLEYQTYDLMRLLELMLEDSYSWSQVDEIAIHLVGPILEKDGRVVDYLRNWSESENFWMRRSSLIAQIRLFRKSRGDAELFFEFAEKMIEEKEFFIRKAIGWTLREMSKSDPDPVYGFLMSVKDRASGLTMREGGKYLSDDQRKTLLQ